MKKSEPHRVTERIGFFGTEYVRIEWLDRWNVDVCTVKKADGTIVAEDVSSAEGQRLAHELAHKEYMRVLGIGGGKLSAALEQGLEIGKGSPGGLTEIWNIKPVDEE
ncbi:Uncharacterised protein [Mycobacteroides abscessus subsp. massiliense]|nr:Uncharacterised protein [Mycobacteroides abscessus subsp. massiliense]